MMFKVVFAYALLRGLGDYLSGRPDLKERLAAVYAARANRNVRRLVIQFTADTDSFAKSLYRASVAARRLERAWRRA